MKTERDDRLTKPQRLSSYSVSATGNAVDEQPEGVVVTVNKSAGFDPYDTASLYLKKNTRKED